MPQKPNVNDLLPMSAVEFAVLLVLADGDSHGYAIVKEIEARSDGQISLLPGNLYAILLRLTESGLIARQAAAPGAAGPDKRRRNYRITPFGRKVAAAEAARMKRMVEAAAASDLIEDTGR
ncbi:MAG TPA: PadR family transcriptional regulator [Acidobacteriota bacterium]|jgi:DNA-binding PadR family transcriptional regulator